MSDNNDNKKKSVFWRCSKWRTYRLHTSLAYMLRNKRSILCIFCSKRVLWYYLSTHLCAMAGLKSWTRHCGIYQKTLAFASFQLGMKDFGQNGDISGWESSWVLSETVRLPQSKCHFQKGWHSLKSTEEEAMWWEGQKRDIIQIGLSFVIIVVMIKLLERV